MDFIGLTVVIQLIVDHINYNIMESVDTINSVQFDTDKQDYDVNSVSYDNHVSVYVIVWSISHLYSLQVHVLWSA